MKTILIVEDEFEISGTLRAILEDEGYSIVVCDNGQEALEYLRIQTPNLVITDSMMPRTSGYALLFQMQQQPRLKNVPTVLMSPVVPSVRRSDYKWTGFLKKPFTVDSLLALVEQLIGSNQVRRPG